MKLTNIKIKVETDEQNQYVLKQHIKLNKESTWLVCLDYGNGSWFGQNVDDDRAVCSVWKGFRHLVINASGDLVIFAFQKHYKEREEKEITFAEFKAMCEPKKTLWDKRLCIMHSGDYTQKDVKEALKEFIDYLQDGMDTEDMPRADWCVQLKAKEIFGDELL